jgi:hypothetical protein
MKKGTKRRGIALAIVFLAIPLIGILLTVTTRRAIAQKELANIEKFQGRLFYMTEYGLNYAYKSFGDDVFGTYTHLRENTTGVEIVNPAAATSTFLFSPALLAEKTYAKDGDGWYEWEWDGVDPEDSLTSSNLSEHMRFKVVRIDVGGAPVGWEVVCEARLGTITRTHRMSGDLESLVDYTVYCAGDREYFNAPMDIDGKQHFNGNVYHRGTTKFVDDFSLTAQNIIMEQEPSDWNDPLNTLGSNGGNIKVKPGGGGTINFNPSLHSANGDTGDWIDKMNSVEASDPSQTLRDSNLGAPQIDPPSYESFQPGGFYARKAQARGGYIDAARVVAVAAAEPDVEKRWLKEITYFHAGEQQQVTHYLVDIRKMNDATDFTDMIYADNSVILTGAGVIPADMNFVSRGSITVAGDFNTGTYTGDVDTNNQVSAGIQAGGHNYFATDGYLELMKTDPNYVYNLRNNKPFGKMYDRDANGALIQPLQERQRDGATYGDVKDDPYRHLGFYGAAAEAIPFISGHMLNNNYGNGSRYGVNRPVPIGQGRREHLENLRPTGQNFTFNKFGSDIALQTADMAPYVATGFESQTLDDGLPWIRCHPMTPPGQRNFGHQVPLVQNIPYLPRGAVRSMWRAF